jgi:cytochrome c556
MIGKAMIAALLVALAAPVLAQDKAQDRAQDKAQDSAAMAAREIFARKILMDTVDRHIDTLDFALAADKPLDLAAATEHADTISVLLLALPHLFPPQTNQWRPNVTRNPARDTYASPALWTGYAEFARQAAAASQLALEMSQAKSPAEFGAKFETLRGLCDACHAAYVQPPD